MRFALDQPLWLLLLALIPVVAVLSLAFLQNMSRLRRFTCMGARAALIILIALLLAQLTIVRESDKLALIAIVDTSQSVATFTPPLSPSVPDTSAPAPAQPALQRAREYINQATADRGPDDYAGLITFSSSPTVLTTPTTSALPPFPLEPAFDRGTDIEAALRLARSSVPPDTTARFLLFSDFNQTTGDALAAVDALNETPPPIPIDVVPFPYEVTSEITLERLDAPPQTQPGAALVLRAVITSTTDTTAALTLLRDDQPVPINPDPDSPTTLPVTLSAGRNIVPIPITLPDARVHDFRVTLRQLDPDADTVAANNTADALTITPTGSAALLVAPHLSTGSPAPHAQNLEDLLDRAKIQTTIIPAEAFPNQLLALHAYDLLILDNTPADAITPAQQQHVVDYVTRLGGGLLTIGGPNAYAPGGWKGSTLEPILPIDLEVPDELVVPATAVAIVLDNSQSMSFSVFGSASSQQQIANNGAALAVRSLDKTDFISVITFNTTARAVVPLQRNTDPEATANTILDISPDGGTNLPPALRLAADQLDAAQADIKHIVVLSDGRSMNTEALPALASQIAGRGINISTIAVGDDADTDTLKQIADIANGEHYRVINPRVLPQIFVKAVRVIRPPLVRLSPFEPVLPNRQTSPVTGALSSPPPTVRGIVLSRIKPTAPDTPPIAYDMLSPDSEPLLARWNAGLGVVSAFTSDTHNWLRDWLDWPDYETFWTTLARTTARPPQDRSTELTLSLSGDLLNITLTATDDRARPRSDLTVDATVYSPDEGNSTITLEQTIPGTYRAQIRADDPGAYLVIATPSSDAERLPPAVSTVSRAAAAEFRALATNNTLASQIARATGARVLDITEPPPADLFSRDGIEPVRARLPLTRTLLLWAFAALLLDIATRRIAWDRWFDRSPDTQDTNAPSRAATTLASLRSRDKAQSTQPQTALTDQDALDILRARRPSTPTTEQPQPPPSARPQRSIAEPAPDPAQKEPASDRQPSTQAKLELLRKLRSREPDDDPDDQSAPSKDNP